LKFFLQISSDQWYSEGGLVYAAIKL